MLREQAIHGFGSLMLSKNDQVNNGEEPYHGFAHQKNPPPPPRNATLPLTNPNLAHLNLPSISPLPPSLSLSGKTILITGGGTGIGLFISKSLCQADATNLIILGRHSTVLSDASATITSQTGNKTNVLTITADVSKQSDVVAAFKEIARKLPGVKLDILVLNAGYFSGLRPLGTETVSEWQSAFEVNTLALYLVSTAFVAAARKDAKIINISTAIAHLPPFPGFSSYASTKLAGTKMLSYFEGEYPELRIVSVHPGQVMETEMAGKAKGAERTELNGHIDDAQLAGDCVVWAASEEAGFLKGKFVWVNWDVEELKGRKEDIESTPLLTLGLEGSFEFKK